MIKVNGSRIDWMRYEFASRHDNGDGTPITLLCESYEDAHAMAEAYDGELVMRAVYATGWQETL